ncbi:MAG TPA: cyanophycin synthetase, partial [Thermomicrobiales bacterium]|nr:cyanophycin synthetase [Thermomicrobiales bacterium]
ADIRRGLTTAYIPGRFEIVAVDGSTTVVLDGAHTPASAQVLANAVRSRYADHRVTAIVAMMADKDPLTFLEPLVSVVDEWFVSQPQTPRALDPDALLVALRQLHASAEVCESVGESVSRSVIAARRHDQRRLILVTGSLSTVAEARSRLGLDATST